MELTLEMKIKNDLINIIYDNTAVFIGCYGGVSIPCCCGTCKQGFAILTNDYVIFKCLRFTCGCTCVMEASGNNIIMGKKSRVVFESVPCNHGMTTGDHNIYEELFFIFTGSLDKLKKIVPNAFSNELVAEFRKWCTK